MNLVKFATCGVDAQSDLNLATSTLFEFPDVNGVFLTWVSCQPPMKKIALTVRNYHCRKSNESRKRCKWSATRSVYVTPVKSDPQLHECSLQTSAKRIPHTITVHQHFTRWIYSVKLFLKHPNCQKKQETWVLVFHCPMFSGLEEVLRPRSGSVTCFAISIKFSLKDDYKTPWNALHLYSMWTDELSGIIVKVKIDSKAIFAF